MFIGTIIIVAMQYLPIDHLQQILAILTAIFYMIHIVRLSNKTINDYYITQYGYLLRPYEINHLPGAFYYLLGCFISTYFCTLPVMTLAVINLSFGDPFASIGGRLFKDVYFNVSYLKGKSFMGCMCCGTICALISMIPYYFCISFQDTRQNKDIFQFLFTTFSICLFSELLPSNRSIGLDDNLTIPIYSSILYSYFLK